jgi:hypothetical protein
MPNDAIGGTGAAELDRKIHSTGKSFSSIPRHRTHLRQINTAVESASACKQQRAKPQ